MRSGAMKRSRIFLVGVVALGCLVPVFGEETSVNVLIKLDSKKMNPFVFSGSAPVAETAKEEPPPPPVPPESVSRDPRRLIRYFCKNWKEENFAEMYYSMSPKYRKRVSFDKFKSIFEADAETNGGLDDENILSLDTEHHLGCVAIVDLKFNFNKARNRRVQAVLEKTKDGFRIKKCGLIPLDMNDL
jgi:hypothetical protein